MKPARVARLLRCRFCAAWTINVTRKDAWTKLRSHVWDRHPEETSVIEKFCGRAEHKIKNLGGNE